MKLRDLLKLVPIDNNIAVFSSNRSEWYSNNEYITDDFKSRAKIFAREDFIDSFGECDVLVVLPSLYGYDDSILIISIE
jgi:hypothetical protein